MGDLTVSDLIRLTNYRDNLLIYIHEHLGLIKHSRNELISLMKEHKEVTKFINEFEKK